MKIKVYTRNIDSRLKIALYAMTEFAMSRLVPSNRLRKNISIDVHLKHHAEGGEAMMSEYTNPRRPREFKVIVDHHRAEIDDYGRKRSDTEWGHNILKTLAHELVHVKQYVMGELKYTTHGMVYKRTTYSPDNIFDYFETPYEIEAYGREVGLLVNFLAKWKEIEEEMDLTI
jgi:hypothetical protein